VNRYFLGKEDHLNSGHVLHRLHRFPAELFAWLMVISLGMSLLYHLASYKYYGGDFLSRQALADVLGSLFSEIALSATLAVMVYSMLRRMLRPYVQQLQKTTVNDLQKTSLARPFLL